MTIEPAVITTARSMILGPWWAGFVMRLAQRNKQRVRAQIEETTMQNTTETIRTPFQLARTAAVEAAAEVAAAEQAVTAAEQRFARDGGRKAAWAAVVEARSERDRIKLANENTMAAYRSAIADREQKNHGGHPSADSQGLACAKCAKRSTAARPLSFYMMGAADKQYCATCARELQAKHEQTLDPVSRLPMGHGRSAA